MNINRLLFYNDIRNDEIVKIAVRIYTWFKNGASEGGVPSDIEDDYYELQRKLLRAVSHGDMEGSYWENYICRLTAESENDFSLKAELGEPDSTIMQLAEGDIAVIKELFFINWKEVAERIDSGRPCVCAMAADFSDDGRAVLVKKALEEKGGGESVRMLTDYYNKNFCGILGKYNAFIWEGELIGVEHQDPVTFDDLIGYEMQQQQLIKNTEVFVNGHKSNNVLLYGDKGTGKSSSVKAVLNMFSDYGLRMINIPKNRIFDIMNIMKSVEGRGCRFILFIDDLSFEDTEVEYKHFKSVLEGGVEVQPDNVLVYVTSNRRNLVKETWKDRNDENGEIHVVDGIQERQSLADRFGLTITFTAPDKELYSEIVKSIAKKEGVNVDEELLISEANKWDMRQTSRSGRSAKQFVTHIAGMTENDKDADTI